MSEIKIEFADAIAIITIDNQDKLNAWNRAMRVTLLCKLKELSEMPAEECRGIVITGAGARAFCAGQDLDEARDWDSAFADTWVSEIRDVYDAVRLCPKPVVAALNGIAAGSGFQFALCCDIRVSHAGAKMGQPEVRSGLASVTGTWLIQYSVGHTRMKDLVLRARLIAGEEAKEWGIVNSLVSEEKVLEEAIQIANEMSELPVESFALTKQAIFELMEAQYSHAFDTAIEYQGKVYETDAPTRAMERFKKDTGS